jgi:formylglycine-generating enzyme required for sulfatase activity
MAIYLVSNLDYRRFLYNRRGVSAVLSHALEESWALAGSQQPAVFVNWYDAKTYAEWLSNELIIVHPNRKHAIYRLPSSMEWEYSARNRMDDRMYPWGNSPAVDRALCSDCRTESDDQTSSIDQFKQTDSGIYSIVGNVTQWTSDAVNPMESADRLPTTKMVLRGGSLNTDASVLRAGIYSESGAIYQHSDGGFRVCRSSS